MRYLQKTKDHMLTYKQSDCLEVTGYSDSNFAECLDTKKICCGIYFPPYTWSKFVKKH